MPYNVGIALRSTRTSSNTAGFSRYLTKYIEVDFSAIILQITHHASFHEPSHPLPLLSEVFPSADHPKETLPGAYENPYNVFDHLFHEWVSLSGGLIALGGHKNSKLQAHLRILAGGDLDMKVA
nr:hypothetical protein L204_05618 [Cryptococcus depauperatus CBS 7855]